MERACVSQATSHIPVDFIISKSHIGLTRGAFTVSDVYGNLVFRVDGRSLGSKSENMTVLLDAARNPLISIHRNGGGWEGFRGASWELKDLIFRVERILHSKVKSELDVVLVGDLSFNFKVKGSPFQRSCTIYQGDSIVAQTNRLHKLGKVIVGRRRFRVTIYPGVHHALVVALLVIFFNG